VVLFDEIEKAHPDIFNILLQILEDGRLTDGQGRTVDFRNTVILMTSNVGAREAARGSTLGFSGGDEKDPFDWSRLKAAIMDEVNRTFRPEFINRLDEMIVFRPLNRENMISIVSIMLEEVVSRLASRDIVLSVGDDVRSFLLDKGYQPKFGARPLRRTIQTHIEDRLADFLLGKGSTREKSIEAFLDGDEVRFRSVAGQKNDLAETVSK